jgi:tRNA(fMet)-specific endonuclease VapC
VGVVLDSSLLIGAERGAVDFERFLKSLKTTPVALAAITAAELLHGCYRARDAGVRARRSAFVDAVLDLVPVLPFGLAEARRYAQLWAELAREGRVIGPHDMLIAATALARGYAVATLNHHEFARVAGLRLQPIERFIS